MDIKNQNDHSIVIMSNFKNLNKVLFLFLILANLYISFEYGISQESDLNNCHVELVITQNQAENDIINFDQLQQSSSLDIPIQSYKNPHDFEYQIQNNNLLEQLKYRVQKLPALNFKL
ncbi:hypothetical protein [Confluentibacter flavum]|nr:hypothetical protein [Confluentibacter flavum]